MKRLEPIDESARFKGGMRHHRRAGGNSQSSWDQWVAADLADRPRRNWPKFIGVLLSLLALAGIAVGLFIEMS